MKKIVFQNKFYTIFHFLSLCVFISIQNIGRSIPLHKKNHQLVTGAVIKRCSGEVSWRGAIERCTLNLDKNLEDTCEGKESVPSRIFFKDFTLVFSNLLLLFQILGTPIFDNVSQMVASSAIGNKRKL